MAVPRRVHEAQHKPRKVRAECAPIHYAATAEGTDARKVRRITAAMTRRFPACLEPHGGGPFKPESVLGDALALGLHFLAIRYLGETGDYEMERVGEVAAVDMAVLVPGRKSKP